MAKFRKKPVIIEAIKFDGENFKECEKFIEGNYDNTLNYPNIKTLEGIMRVSAGDYIIKGVDGEFYPCKPTIFEKTYDEVDDPFGPVTLTESELEAVKSGVFRMPKPPTAEELLEESAQIQQDFNDIHG